MRVAVIGGGINGLCCAWRLVECGHAVTLYERGRIMEATSRSSSKLLHGGLRYLENGEFRLVREALRERDAWIRRNPHLTWPIRLVMPIYRGARRPKWMVSLGLFAYDRIAGRTSLPRATWLSATQMLQRDPKLRSRNLTGGYEFSDAQMDDYALGIWVSKQAQALGLEILEGRNVQAISTSGTVFVNGTSFSYDRILNVTGPWATQLLTHSGINSPYQLSLVRGSHLILESECSRPYLLEVPGQRRICFVLPWNGATLVGTTEEPHDNDAPIECSERESAHLLSVYGHYFPDQRPKIAGRFACLRPLIHSSNDPNRMTREYALHRDRQLLTVYGGKWTTSLALADRVIQTIQ